MNSMIAKWEDEENNRQVQFLVEYTTENAEIEITNVTPRQVDFTNNQSSIGVHTTKGRVHLAEKIKASGHLNLVKNNIAQQEGLLTTV